MRVSSTPAREKNEVSVAPGIKQVTVTPVSASYVRNAYENDRERFCAVIDGLERSWHEPCDRAYNQDAPVSRLSHFPSDTLNKTERAGDVGIDHMLGRIEVFVKEAVPGPRPALALRISIGREHALIARHSASTPGSVLKSACTPLALTPMELNSAAVSMISGPSAATTRS
jgi:hypothetical protein